MTMNYEQWKRMLSAVDKEEGLSKDNVIERIKEKLKAENGEDEYKKWEEAGFDVNYLFEVESNVFIQCITLSDFIISLATHLNKYPFWRDTNNSCERLVHKHNTLTKL